MFLIIGSPAAAFVFLLRYLIPPDLDGDGGGVVAAVRERQVSVEAVLRKAAEGQHGRAQEVVFFDGEVLVPNRELEIITWLVVPENLREVPRRVIVVEFKLRSNLGLGVATNPHFTIRVGLARQEERVRVAKALSALHSDAEGATERQRRARLDARERCARECGRTRLGGRGHEARR